MQYKDLGQRVPQERRAEVNSKILQLIDADNKVLTQEEIYNLYSGDGGLHGLQYSNFTSFHKYTKAKQEIENGQFFTPHAVVEEMVKILQPKDNDFIADITCGAGVFFNFFNPEYCYGTDIDLKSLKVAKYLYPDAKIDNRDIRYYDPGLKMDVIIGNPPFNLRWDWKSSENYSQFFYVKKAGELLKPGGFLMFICPDSFLKDNFYHKSAIEKVEEDFNFICQYKIDKAAFKDVGVKNFATKVMIFQKNSEHLEFKPFKNVYVTPEEAFILMKKMNEVRVSIRAKVMLEIARDTNPDFDFKLKKYMYEIKVQPALKKLYPKAVVYVEKFHTQKCPDNMEYAEWEKKHKITEAMVLSYLKRTVAKQSRVDREEIRVISYQYGYKVKGYDSKTRKIVKGLGVTHIKKYQLIDGAGLPKNWRTFSNAKDWKRFGSEIFKLQAKYTGQSYKFSELDQYPEGQQYLDKFTFISKGKECQFIDIQKVDLVKVLQKDFAILNWQQGSGKTPAAMAYALFKPLKNTVITSAALAINLTWVPFLEANGLPMRFIYSAADIRAIQPGEFVLVTMEYANKYQKELKKWVKGQRQKVTMIFDESDEITNNTSLRTKAILNIFRRCRRKLLATGTTTRNNITELYSQLELLYNNSYNMICDCSMIYKEDRENSEYSIKEIVNEGYGHPFPAYRGNLLFKRCYNPNKTTVFGIQKHNQDIYNEESLRGLLEKTVITKKFKDIAGNKYTPESVLISQKSWEREVYSKILREFQSIVGGFYKSTGNSRKDSMLKILQQIDLLIRAVSVPQVFKGSEKKIPAKFERIRDMIASMDEKVAIGCTTIPALERYTQYIKEQFPNRTVFSIAGQISFKSRKKMLEEFEQTENGILIATQMSLKSSINIPCCQKVIIESLQWNIPKIEQFYFRFIRFDSPGHTTVYFVNYENTIEMNLMALLMAKERLNDYIKTLQFKDQAEMFDEYGVDLDILNSLMVREKDEEGNLQLKWGDGTLV